jgi:thiamine biosynthesis lipoprotein
MSLPVRSIHREAMNTVFTIRLPSADLAEAERLTGECFLLLETLEALLSRFRPDSDISRINRLNAGESLWVDERTARCLRLAIEASQLTEGLFDATLSPAAAQTERPGQLRLAEDGPRVFCEAAGRQIDLGGIGKGFALDEMAAVLKDLEVPYALLSAGASTHLAFGNSSWKICLDPEAEASEYLLQEEAISSSGTAQQGCHILHPDTGMAPSYHFSRVWLATGCAALADAFSTAALLMDADEINAFVASQAGRVKIFTQMADSGEK